MNKQQLRSSQLRWVLVILFIIWVFAVSAIFYVTQKPISPTDFFNLLSAERTPFTFSWGAFRRTLFNILAAAWLWLMSLGPGLWIYQWFFGKGMDGHNRVDLPERILFSFGLGLGTIALIIFG